METNHIKPNKNNNRLYLEDLEKEQKKDKKIVEDVNEQDCSGEIEYFTE